MERDGKQYVYRSTSHYSEEKKGPVSEVEYMGVMKDGKLKPKRGYFYDEETKEFGPIELTPAIREGVPDRVVRRTKRFGDVYLLMALQKRLGILDDLVLAFGSELGRTIMAVAMAYAIRPAALMHIESTIERRYIPEILGLDPDTDFSSQRMSELTRAIGSDDESMYAFFHRRIQGSEGEFIFDLTTETSYSARNPMVEWGRNKDRIPAKNINLGLVCDRVGRPLMFYTYPGSMADIVTLRRVVRDVKALGGKDSTLVMDRGFVSTGSLYDLMEERMDFLVPMTLGDNPVLKGIVTELTSLCGNVDHTVVHGGCSYTLLVTQLGIRRNRGGNTDRVTVWEDPDGYDLVAEGDQEFGSCEHFIDVFTFRDTAAAGSAVANMDVILNDMINMLEGTKPRNPQKRFEKVTGALHNLLQWDLDEDKRMHLRVKQNAHTFAANRKGVFMMVTPAGTGRTTEWVLDTYECRDMIEDTFLQDKSEGDGRTPRSGDRETIEGRTFIRMVSMIMTVDIKNRLAEYCADRSVKPKDKPRNISHRTPESLLESLDNIEIIEGKGWREMTEPTKDNRLIFKMFDVGPPKDITR